MCNLDEWVIGLFFCILLCGIPGIAVWGVYFTLHWTMQPDGSVSFFVLVMALLWSVVLLLGAFIYAEERIRRRREQLTVLLIRAGELLRQGKCEEAAVILNHYKSLLVDGDRSRHH